MNSFFSRRFQPSKNILMAVLTAAAIFTLAFTAIGSINTSKISNGFQDGITTDFQLQRLSSNIIHLDEVLTMSSRMAAATGDLAWEDRYKAYEPILIQAVNQAINLAPQAYDLHAKQIDNANTQLIEMEKEAFKQVRENKTNQALKVLFSERYITQKEIYSNGIQQWTQFLDNKIKTDFQQYSKGLFWAGTFSTIGFWLSMALWTGLLSLINQYSRHQNIATQALRQTQQQLSTHQQSLQHCQQVLQQKTHALEALSQALHQAQTRIIQDDKIARLGQLTVGVAHQLNRPVQLSAGRIRHIAQALRHATGDQDANHEFIDIHDSIENTLLLLQHRLSATPRRPAITVAREYTTVPLTAGYIGPLNQVLINLITNAIDALDEAYAKPTTDSVSNLAGPSAKAQSATTQASVPRPSQITLRTTAITDPFNVRWITIAIADNGIGIPEAAQDRIFEAFFSTKLTGKGVGVGLSNSYAIIADKHNGRLTFTTTPHQGTEFVIQLPVTRHAAPVPTRQLIKTKTTRRLKASHP